VPAASPGHSLPAPNNLFDDRRERETRDRRLVEAQPQTERAKMDGQLRAPLNSELISETPRPGADQQQRRYSRKVHSNGLLVRSILSSFPNRLEGVKSALLGFARSAAVAGRSASASIAREMDQLCGAIIRFGLASCGV